MTILHADCHASRVTAGLPSPGCLAEDDDDDDDDDLRRCVWSVSGLLVCRFNGGGVEGGGGVGGSFALLSLMARSNNTIDCSV